MAAPASARPDVSVIVPVCNVEDYLGQCLESLSAQTLESIEFVCVDDGSSDSCPDILAAAAADEPRMRVITKQNGGYGSAVNAGLAEARGRFIGIVEPDDFIDRHMYADLLEAAQLPGGGEADICKGGYWEYYDVDGEPPRVVQPNLMAEMPTQKFCSTVKEDFDVIIHHPSIWSAIYKRDFLEAHHITMLEVPGGGWVDNTFFFETFLQAESFVWLPCAYYYYRQSNPNSSSNLKDVNLPFDRLRDLRALFERLGVDDPQLLACLYARHFYYCASTMTEWGFRESDPEVDALVREAVGAMDERVVYGGHKGIQGGDIAFFESVKRNPARGIPKRGARSREPRVSFIVPLTDTRDTLVQVLCALAKQDTDDIEVICVDCGSVDASVRIARAFAKRDARFTFLAAGGAGDGGGASTDGGVGDAADDGAQGPWGLAAGIAAALGVARAPMVSVVIGGRVAPADFADEVARARAEGVDVVVCGAERSGRGFSLAGGAQGGKDGQDGQGGQDRQTLPVAGREAEVVLLATEQKSVWAVRTDVARECADGLDDADAEAAWLVLGAACRAGSVQVTEGEGCSLAKPWRRLVNGRPTPGFALWQSHRDMLDGLYERAGDLGDGAVRAVRCLAVQLAVDDVRELASTDDGERVFDDVRACFRGRWGLADEPRAAYCNAPEFCLLEYAVFSDYERFLRSEWDKTVKYNKRLSRKVDDVRESVSYRLGNRAVKAAKSILPPGMQRKLGD